MYKKFVSISFIYGIVLPYIEGRFRAMSHNENKDTKHKVTIYVPNPLYNTLMDEVFRRMKERQQFRGMITEVAVDALRFYFDSHPQRDEARVLL